MSGIKLRLNNPYIIGVITEFDDNTRSLDRKRIIYASSIRDQYHIVTDFDTLSDLANKFYSDSKLWWILQDVNDLENGFELPVGKSIIIPDINKIRIGI